MHRIDRAKCRITVATGSGKCRTVAARADTAIDDPRRIDTVERDEGCYALPILAFSQEVANASEIAGPFLAYSADKQDIRLSLDADADHGPDNGQQHGEAARIICYARCGEPLTRPANPNIGSPRKY